MNKVIFIFLIACCIIACDSSRVYDDYVDLEEAFWHMDSVKEFSFQIEETNKSYNILVSLRNASAYPFYNIYFQYHLTDSLDSVVYQQLEKADLFDPVTGEPQGSGLGDLFDHSIPILERFSFDSPGTYKLKLQQQMRLDSLPFILAVGARVEIVED